MSILNPTFEAPSTGSPSQEVYSTEEQRIGTWIDGKPLYRKCFNTRTASSNSVSTVAYIDENVEVKFIRATCTDKNGSTVNFPLWLNDNYWVAIWATQVYINMQTSQSALQDVPCVVAIEYTKTTDAAPTAAKTGAEPAEAFVYDTMDDYPAVAATCAAVQEEV